MLNGEKLESLVDGADPEGKTVFEAGAIQAIIAERDSLRTELSQAKGEVDRLREAAKSFAEKNTVLRKIASHVRGIVWIKAKEEAGFGTAIQAQISDPKADEAWLEFITTAAAPESQWTRDVPTVNGPCWWFNSKFHAKPVVGKIEIRAAVAFFGEEVSPWQQCKSVGGYWLPIPAPPPLPSGEDGLRTSSKPD